MNGNGDGEEAGAGERIWIWCPGNAMHMCEPGEKSNKAQGAQQDASARLYMHLHEAGNYFLFWH